MVAKYLLVVGSAVLTIAALAITPISARAEDPPSYCNGGGCCTPPTIPGMKCETTEAICVSGPYDCYSSCTWQCEYQT